MRFTADKANRRYFREAYRSGQHGWEVEQPSRFAMKCLRRLTRLIPGGRCLDIGCGEGRHSIAAAKLGFKVTGMDLEPLALKRARQFARRQGATDIRFLVADVLRLPLSDASFDIVIDYGCLHHQKKSDWPAYRASLLRVLKPGGHYVLSVFSPRFRLFARSRRPWHIAYGAYRRCFTRQEITDLFGGSFQVVEIVEQDGSDGGFWHVLMKRRKR
ncbi:MAG TPA: class I SAM-dependent methyltransferase [Phycisphaerae bacterium]|nr:class I SAM-dependent methyltransferase [Phycisphaerae bacterium]